MRRFEREHPEVCNVESLGEGGSWDLPRRARVEREAAAEAAAEAENEQKKHGGREIAGGGWRKYAAAGLGDSALELDYSGGVQIWRRGKTGCATNESLEDGGSEVSGAEYGRVGYEPRRHGAGDGRRSGRCFVCQGNKAGRRVHVSEVERSSASHASADV